MSDKTTLENQVIKEVKKGKSGSGEYGNWTIYKIKLAQNDKTFSWFGGDADLIPTPGMTALIIKYEVTNTESNGKQYTNYTIKTLELDASNSVASGGAPNKSNADFDDSRNVSFYIAYAKDILIALLPFNEKLQKATHEQLCDGAAFRGKRMFKIAKDNKPVQAAITTPKPEPKPEPKQEEPQPPEDDDLPF